MTQLAAIKIEAHKAIVEHLARVGPHEWAALRSQFPQFSESTWWRLVRRIQKGAPDPDVLERKRKRIKAKAKETTQEEKVQRAAKMLPALPSPQYLARAGADAEISLNLLAEFQSLKGDAALLRQHSMSADGEKIRIPKYFIASMDKRLNIVDSALETVKQIYDLRYMDNFYKLVLEEIGKLAPETLEAVLSRMEELAVRHGVMWKGTV